MPAPHALWSGDTYAGFDASKAHPPQVNKTVVLFLYQAVDWLFMGMPFLTSENGNRSVLLFWYVLSTEIVVRSVTLRTSRNHDGDGDGDADDNVD